MGDIERIYEDLETEEVSLEEFRAAVESKIEQSGGDIDERRAAELLAHEIAGPAIEEVGAIDPLMETVSFLGTAIRVGDRHTFERDDPDQPEGQVLDATVGDRTGAVRVTFWDELADSAASELEPGMALKLRGRPDEGEELTEVSAEKVGAAEAEVEIDPIQRAYLDLDAEVTFPAFRERVEAKVEEMGDLVDRETAAELIAYDLEETSVDCVADVEPGMETATFTAKVLGVGDLRTFERDDPEQPDGQVRNVEVADETGQIRISLWDEMAGESGPDLEPGTVVEVEGRPTDGYSGVEVSVDEVERVEETIDVEATDEYQVTDLTPGVSDVNLVAEVLATEPIRTFDRDDGSEGQVSNLLVGDETGRIRVTLWDEQADRVEEFVPHDVVEIIDGYVKDRDDTLELHVGDHSVVETTDEEMSYEPDTTPIEAVELDATVDIAGVIRSADPKRTFDRDDGSEGQVRNVRVQDDTGDIRVALWGEKADLDLGPGDEVLFVDVAIQDGWQDDLEASANWQSTIVPLEETEPSVEDTEGGDTGLSEFTDGSAPTDTASEDDIEAGTSVEFTGVVVQARDPVILDDGEQTVTLQSEADVELGEELTVTGDLADGALDPESIEGTGNS